MLVMVVAVFANNFLSARMAESEFNTAKQFMTTIGLQIDDVAWTIGRTETGRYTNRYGSVAIVSALNYTIYANTTSTPKPTTPFYKATTSILCYNVRTSSYSLGDLFYQLIYPSNGSFLLSGTSVPVARVFTVEKLQMPGGSFVRVVAAPVLRMVNLTIGTTKYVRLFLPVLAVGNATYRYPTVTMKGQSLSRLGQSITGIKIVVSFPRTGYDNIFFNFPRTAESISLTTVSVLELFVGGVKVDLGVNP